MAEARDEFPEAWLTSFKNTFRYDPVNGRIYYRIYYMGHNPDTIADSFKHIGYRNGVSRGVKATINFKNIRVNSHRAAVFLMTGSFPSADTDIDHADGDTTNNAWSNIRVATKTQNSYNAKLRVDNTSGIKGVSKTPFNTWRASLVINGKETVVGTFKAKEEAAEAVRRAREFHHKEFANHGESNV